MRRAALLLPLLATGAVGTVVLVSQASAATVTADGTRIGGLDVGGLSKAQVVDRLRRELGQRPDRVVLRMGQASLAVGVTEVGASLDVDASAERALEQSGRKLAGVLPLGGGSDVEPVLALDDDQLGRTIDRALRASTLEPFAGDLRWTGTSLTAVPPRDGQAADEDDVRKALLRALGQLPAPAQVEVPVTTQSPEVTSEDIAGLATRADAALRDLTLTAAASPATTRTAPLARRQLGPLLTLEAGASGPRLALRAAAAKPVVEGLVDQLSLAPAEPRFATPDPVRGVLEAKGDATWSPRPAAVRVLSPGRDGQQVTASDVGSSVLAALEGLSSAPVTVPATARPPRTTAAQAAAVNSLIGTFTTSMPCCVPRVKNIQLIARTVNGTVIAPGQQFSLNGIVGRRTRAKGYVEAPFILNGKLDKDIGGGVSQFATTTYNAAFFAGLQLDFHKAHSFYISRYPVGREATVNYPSLDLTWTNDTGAPVIVRTMTTGTSVTVALYGNNGGRAVRAITGKRIPVPGKDFRITVTRTISGPVDRQDKVTTLYIEHPPDEPARPAPRPSSSPSPRPSARPTPSPTPSPAGG